MSAVDKAVQTQLTNIQTKTGKSLEELGAILQQSGLAKHSEIRAMFQRDLGLGYGDANMLAQVLRDTAAGGSTAATAETPDDVANALYAGAKAWSCSSTRAGSSMKGCIHDIEKNQVFRRV